MSATFSLQVAGSLVPDVRVSVSHNNTQLRLQTPVLAKPLYAVPSFLYAQDIHPDELSAVYKGGDEESAAALAVTYLPLNCSLGITYDQAPPVHNPTIAQSLQNIATEPTDSFSIHFLFPHGQKRSDSFSYVALSMKSSDKAHTQETFQTLKRLIVDERILRDPRPIFVLINPFGGTKSALTVWNARCQPIFQLAGVPYEVQTTTAKGSATTSARTIDYTKYRAMVTVSGDGLFHEVVEGLFDRPDWQEVATKLPLGYIGAGTSNGMSSNIGAHSPEIQSLNIIQNSIRSLDIISYTQNNKTRYSHLELLFGLLADLDIESEQYRWMGILRNYVGAIVRLLYLRSTGCKLWLLSPDGDKRTSNIPPVPSSVLSDHSQHGPRVTIEATTVWTEYIDEDITNVSAVNYPFIACDFMAGPRAKLSDGLLDVNICHSRNKSAYLSALLEGESGKYLHQKEFISRKCSAIVLEPGERRRWKSNDGRRGIVDVSGEEVDLAPILIQVHQGLARLCVPAWYDESMIEQAWKN